MLPGFLRVALRSLRMTVRKRDIGLDIKDRRPVHQIRPKHGKHRPLLFRKLHALQPDTGQADAVRAKGRTGGKHPQPRIPSQPGRPHRGLPALPFIFRKFPQKPDMAELLQPPDRIRIPEFRLKNDPSLQILHQSALPGDPEFFREIRMDMRDRLNLIHLFFRSFPAASDLPARKPVCLSENGPDCPEISLPAGNGPACPKMSLPAGNGPACPKNEPAGRLPPVRFRQIRPVHAQSRLKHNHISTIHQKRVFEKRLEDTFGGAKLLQEAFREYRKFFSAFSGFPDPCRRILPLTTGQHAILLIPAVETCRRSGSCPPTSRRTGTRPGIPHRLRRAGRIQAGTLFLRAGQQVTGAGLNRQGPDPPG